MGLQSIIDRLGEDWTLALAGIVFKTTSLGFRFHRTSVALYVIMGWLAIVAIRPSPDVGPG